MTKQLFGQHHLLDDNKPLNLIMKNKQQTSMLLYGPPGTGKTTFAELYAKECGMYIEKLNGTSTNKKELTDLLNKSVSRFSDSNNTLLTLLLIDEIHVLTKPYQNLLLPYLDMGIIKIIGTSTENPYFSILPALQSRISLLFEFKYLENDDMINYLNSLSNNIPMTIIESISLKSNGDVRKAENLFQICQNMISSGSDKKDVSVFLNGNLNENRSSSLVETHYLLMSALQKSVRGSDPNASIYYLACLINIGDIQSIIRRLKVCAYEDVGLGDFDSVNKAIIALNVAESIGLPEARIPLSNATLLLAKAKKNNKAYLAINQALDYVEANGIDVNPILDNNNKDYEYKYPFNYDGNVVEQRYLPDGVEERFIY